MMKMKRTWTLLLLAIYMTSMAGFAFNLHYCSGKLAEVALYKPVKPCKMCAKAGAEEKHGCCKTAVVDVKVKDDHQSVSKVFVSKAAPEVILPDWAVFSPEKAHDAAPKMARLSSTAPPPLSVPLSVLNCVFRI